MPDHRVTDAARARMRQIENRAARVAGWPTLLTTRGGRATHRPSTLGLRTYLSGNSPTQVDHPVTLASSSLAAPSVSSE